MNVWLAITGMALLTLAIRASFLVLGRRWVFPPWLARALHYVPVAVLSALVVPMALAPGGSIALSWQNPYLIGTLCAGVLAWYGGRTLPALVASFVLFAVLRYFS